MPVFLGHHESLATNLHTPSLRCLSNAVNPDTNTNLLQNCMNANTRKRKHSKSTNIIYKLALRHQPSPKTMSCVVASHLILEEGNRGPQCSQELTIFQSSETKHLKYVQSKLKLQKPQL
jgi:hypothetical protein